MAAIPLHLVQKLKRAVTFADLTEAELLTLGGRLVSAVRPDLIKREGDKLPTVLKEDLHVIMLRCCPGHDEPLGNDFIDGPLPTVKNCSLCINKLLLERPELFFSSLNISL
jgi:hypothetical protein